MNLELFKPEDVNIISLKEAARFVTKLSGKLMTVSNISYLVQYGRIKKFTYNGSVFVSKTELANYYSHASKKRQEAWNNSIKDNINWALSFEEYKEAETTKHVHRLHPYKGKFIPQLVEYFLDNHTDKFKRDIFFKRGDVILDPFSGSGTALVEANELGIHAIGIDVSPFNAMISNMKVDTYNLATLQNELEEITQKLSAFTSQINIAAFEEELSEKLSAFNAAFFPSPTFKIQVRNKEIDERKYGKEKEKEFLPIYEKLVNKFNIRLRQVKNETFLEKWYIQNVRNEINFVENLIEKVQDEKNKTALKVILSRTVRSCRATTHSDLATIYEPIMSVYYCTKHAKICKPPFSISKWWETYAKDTLKRLHEFSLLKTPTLQYCLAGDSRTIDIHTRLKQEKNELYNLITSAKISGIFSSPPYVGLIDYHEQHAYAYELFSFKRNDELEIGALFRGKGKAAREEYIKGITLVLLNAKKYLKNDYNVFLVANDRYNLYPLIAQKAGMKIVNQYHRPVLNRTEKDKSAYSETIFHMKEI